MSHLSKIKTKISNQRILQKTLSDLKLKYYCIQKTDKQNIGTYPQDIVMQDSNNNFKFTWKESRYFIVTDLQLWKSHIPYNILLERITQQYSYNSIVNTSLKEGFTNLGYVAMDNGSIKLTIQKWN